MTITLALCLTFIAFTALNAARVVLTLYALTLGAPASSVGVLGPMVFGAIGTAFGVPPVFWINAGIMAATGFMSPRGSTSRR